MLNPTIISGKLRGLVGFKQPFNPDFQIIDSDNQGSRSGYFVTDNPMIKVEYIKESQDYIQITDADFNEYLKRAQDASVQTVANAVFNKPDYIDRQVLYKNASNKTNLETLPDGFVGYKIEVSQDKNIAFEITRIMLDFSGSGDIELLLFNTNQKTPLFSKVITINTDHQEDTLNWVVDNSGATYKGDYYLGYISTYVGIGTLKPYKRDYNNGNVESIVTHLCIEQGKVDNHSTNTLFDLEDWDGMSETTGLNPDITVYDDYTDLIINNEKLFARAIKLDMQIFFISEMLNSLRANRDKRLGERYGLRLQAEIDGFEEGGIKKAGLKTLLNREIHGIRSEVKKLEEGYFGNQYYTVTLN